MMNGVNSKNKTHLVIILSSDRGLCGGLNTATVKYAKNYIDSLIKDHKTVKIFCIGKKAYDQLKSRYEDKIIKTNFGIFKNNIEYSSALAIADEIIALFDKGGFDVCSVIYSKFKSAIAQDVIIKQLIPVDIKSKGKEHLIESPVKYEESQEKLLHDLLPKNLAMQIYNELLENSASEQGARMAAMESATNNAGKMIKSLTLIYNRTRQANITRELIDIVSGANAV
jgi:F-type H+-transporting ATPase subunit gamma